METAGTTNRPRQDMARLKSRLDGEFGALAARVETQSNPAPTPLAPSPGFHRSLFRPDPSNPWAAGAANGPADRRQGSGSPVAGASGAPDAGTSAAGRGVRTRHSHGSTVTFDAGGGRDAGSEERRRCPRRPRRRSRRCAHARPRPGGPAGARSRRSIGELPMQPTILGDFVDDLSRSREPGGVRGEARRPGLARPRGRAGALARSILRPSAGEPKAGCASRRPPESLRPAPCEPPAPGQNRPAGLPVALARAVAPARHAAAAFLVVFAALLAVSTTAQAQTTGICGRTAAVRTAILGKISGVSNCANVTDAHLAAITGTLDLRAKRITALAAGDFEELTALTELRLSYNRLATLPANVFDGLTALTELQLQQNSLTTLPARRVRQTDLADGPRFPPGCCWSCWAIPGRPSRPPRMLCPMTERFWMPGAR